LLADEEGMDRPATLQAAIDPLTGLLNRRAFENHAEELTVARAGFAFVMADLDHFGLLNQTHGQEAGDEALRLFARAMLRMLRSHDLVCRYGEDEFVIVIPDVTTAEAVRALERLRAELHVELSSGNGPGFTVSFGVTHSDTSFDIEELRRHASAALFRAKSAGRDRVVADGDRTP
jgi:diguanylate cyclase (GGDEF)-like protein